MKRSLYLLSIIALGFVFQASASAETARKPLGLAVGKQAPMQVPVQTKEGQNIALADVIEGRPTLLVFYRGGWCPYCTTHLSALAGIEAQLNAKGVQVVALSPDSPESVAATLADEENAFTYTLLSDSDMQAARAYGVAFNVNVPTQIKLRAYGIDIAQASGKSHKQLPHPAAFLIDAQGAIQFAYVNANYKERVNLPKLLEAAQNL